MKDLRVIILAAGKGTRMNSSQPKVLHALLGRPLIQYAVDIAQKIGSLKTYVVLGYENEKVRDILPKEVKVVIQKKLLGTADAVKCVGGFLKGYNGDVLILCGDTPLLKKETVKALIVKHKKSKAVCTFLTAVVLEPQGYGRIIRDDNSRAVAIREEKDASESEKNIAEINVGVYCFQSKILMDGIKGIKINQKKKEFYLTDMIGLLAERKLKIETLETEDIRQALGINTREDLAAAHSIMREKILKQWMFQGVTIIDPHTTFIDQGVKIGKDTIIRPFTVIENNVSIGENCIIGPFSRLRSGTKIGRNVEVGNYTEVSRTRIGNHCFMKHFSFLGDARVGNRVNIGAGTVTANFDGKQKNVTHIADDAFIGSDSILIAPVKIGKKAITAAGSVVLKGKNVPDKGIVMGVPARLKTGNKKQ